MTTGGPKHPDKPFEELRKAHEGEYFKKQELEKIAKLKNRQDMAGEGIKDPELADKLKAAGYTADTVRALFIIPLVQVAWADNHMEPEERDEIMNLIGKRGIESGSEAYKLVQGWLDNEPTDTAYSQGLELLRPMIEESKQLDADMMNWVVTACTKVAEATGGLFNTGLGGSVSKHEAEVIQKVTKRLSAK
jgi:hypothetical protein